MARTSLKVTAFLAGLVISGSAFAAPHFATPATGDFSPVQPAASSLANPGGPAKKKICKNTFHAGGIRCTTCTYTNYPEHVTVNCIKINTGSNNSGGGASQTFNGLSGSNRLKFR